MNIEQSFSCSGSGSSNSENGETSMVVWNSGALSDSAELIYAELALVFADEWNASTDFWGARSNLVTVIRIYYSEIFVIVLLIKIRSYLYPHSYFN